MFMSNIFWDGNRQIIENIKDYILVSTTEKYYNKYNECIYVKTYDHELKGITYEEWREYHYNGELKEIRNSHGDKFIFDDRGVPIV